MKIRIYHIEVKKFNDLNISGERDTEKRVRFDESVISNEDGKFCLQSTKDSSPCTESSLWQQRSFLIKACL